MPNAMLFVCRACGTKPGQGAVAPDAGLRLAEALAALPFPEGVALRLVECLSGCPNPCNVALRAPGKPGLRFRQLNPSDAELIMRTAALYAVSLLGLTDAELPPPLRGRLSAQTPPARVVGT